jgi:autotransporter passenger strand-loop-strand repeat protein
VSNGQSIPGLVVNNGTLINVLAGGTITTATINTGGSVVVSVGGLDSGSTIAAGGAELVYGSATGDVIAGLQTVSTGTTAGVVNNETIVNGGVVYLAVKTTSASNMTVDSGGALNINGAISATNITLSGGTVDLESAKATLTGSLIFGGGGTLLVTGNTSAGAGDLAVITGFAAGDVIDMTAATTLGAATGDTLSSSTSGGNTVITVSGGGVSDTYIFAGTTIAPSLTLTSDNAGGQALIVGGAGAPVTSVGSGSSVSNITVNSGQTLSVYNGGTIVDTTIQSGGSVVVLAGGVDQAAVISAGGSETLLGSASGDSVYGTQTLGGATAVASNETVQSGGSVALTAAGAAISGATVVTGGSLTLSGGGTAVNTTDAGGTVTLQTPTDTLAGSFTFNGPGTLDINAVSNAGAGDQAVISGFYAGDVVNTPFGAGATLSATTSGGNTVATVTSGAVSETLIFAGTVAANLTLQTVGGVAQVDYAAPPTTSSYTPGDLVLSVYGDGSGTGSYSLDQAAPITLEEITASGAIVSDQELPQTTTIVNGTTEYAISGEYQSASEGLLTLSADGRSLAIAGYGVTAVAFDAANAGTVYGTTALGQTTSIQGGSVTAVARVVADIGYNGSVDTSTALYGIFNTNNPRSVVTVNGTTFYLGGQGNGTDGTEGVFVANDGASSATAVYNSKTDARDVEINNGTLYVSIDSKLNAGGGLYDFSSALPTGQSAPVELPGIGSSITLTAAEENSVNASAVGTVVNLSPEQYFFASPTVLYVADGGDPKEGGLGDGGLQKWSLVGNTWTLDYTLSTGLNQVPDTQADGTTGLVGLTGTVEGGNVVLYATNETVAETDQTYLYSITDPLTATTAPSGESFKLLDTAAPDTLIRGVAFAPTSTFTTPVVSTALTVSSGTISAGLTVTAGGTITVLNGGTVTGTTLLSGASAVVSSGGVDSGGFIAHGASETLLGTASYDIVDGTQVVSNATAVVTSEVIENGGSLDLFQAGAIANGTTINPGGTLFINGRAYADNTVISGGAMVLESPKATVSGTLDFVGPGGTLYETATISSMSGGLSFGDQAPVSGFGAGDAIDDRVMNGGTLTTTVNAGGTVIATLTSGTVAQSFTFAGSNGISGSAYQSGLSAVSDGSGGTQILYTPPPPTDIIVSANQTSSALSITSGNEITVLNGGTMSGITVYSGGSAVISNGGEDLASLVLAGGTETVSGDANGDQVYGLQIVTSGPSGATLPATVENETVFNGGTVELYLKPDVGSNITVDNGGSLLLSGNVSAVNTTLEAGAYMALQSPKAVIGGGLVFAGSATVAITAVTSSGFGGSAGLITGWQAGDVIDETLTSPGTASLSLTTSGGNTVATITGATFPDVFVFAGTAVANTITLEPDGSGGVELAYMACFVTGTRVQTEHGPRAVETLAVGERVITAAGAARPIRWIGTRALDCTRHPQPQTVWPVVVRRDAFGPALPARDLWLSPAHAVAWGGVLMPVSLLQNGRTVLQVQRPRVEYWHVELDSHDLLLTEGLATESYLDTGNRCAFVNGGAYIEQHPDFLPRHAAETCIPLVFGGPEVARAKALLLDRAAAAGHEVADEAGLHVVADGRVIRPIPLGDLRFGFVVPPGAADVALRSRWFVPAHMEPGSDDGRRLGVCVRRVQVDGMDVSLGDPAWFGQGWYGLEYKPGLHDQRWTDGEARLPTGLNLLVIDLAVRARYWAERPGQAHVLFA